jgi:hypothetical protein
MIETFLFVWCRVVQSSSSDVELQNGNKAPQKKTWKVTNAIVLYLVGQFLQACKLNMFFLKSNRPIHHFSHVKYHLWPLQQLKRLSKQQLMLGVKIA